MYGDENKIKQVLFACIASLFGSRNLTFGDRYCIWQEHLVCCEELHFRAEMFAQAYQSGLISLLYSVGCVRVCVSLSAVCVRCADVETH